MERFDDLLNGLLVLILRYRLCALGDVVVTADGYASQLGDQDEGDYKLH